MYNFFSTLEGKEIILKGWKKAGILELVYGSTIIPPDDPFKEIYSETLKIEYYLFCSIIWLYINFVQ